MSAPTGARAAPRGPLFSLACYYCATICATHVPPLRLCSVLLAPGLLRPGAFVTGVSIFQWPPPQSASQPVWRPIELAAGAPNVVGQARDKSWRLSGPGASCGSVRRARGSLACQLVRRARAATACGPAPASEASSFFASTPRWGPNQRARKDWIRASPRAGAHWRGKIVRVSQCARARLATSASLRRGARSRAARRLVQSAAPLNLLVIAPAARPAWKGAKAAAAAWLRVKFRPVRLPDSSMILAAVRRPLKFQTDEREPERAQRSRLRALISSSSFIRARSLACPGVNEAKSRLAPVRFGAFEVCLLI